MIGKAKWKTLLRFLLLTLLTDHSMCESVSEVPEILEMAEEVLEAEGDHIKGDTDEGPDMEDMWIHYALLDLAYYLRSHKFNEYDRRYITDEEKAVKEYYKRFPEPPLRTFQWEVHKRCSLGFIECLKYSTEITNVALLQKDADPYYIARKKGWTYSRNRDEIARTNTECQRLFKEDWESPVPFVGPIHRFQWRTTMSYYMCLFTLREHPDLSLFGEPCNNYANCWMDGKPDGLSDPRADDRVPFNCARFSFCPDPCCPIKEISSFKDCDKDRSNPCPVDIHNRTCVLEVQKNFNLQSMAKNHWNLTCHCKEKGTRWESRFGLCVDINECEEGHHNCSEGFETCLNLKGSYRCCCAFGYYWNSNNGSCDPMQSIIDRVNEATLIQRPDKSELRKGGHRKHLKKLFFWQRKQEETTEATILKANSHGSSILSPSLPFCFILLISVCNLILTGSDSSVTS
ncbi:unnamed protein product [Nezara viridula]|uniref:EGF-like calcium-binding domain-containing protein n=1 Tax=Nezara viridula TaxID=85310 RepID=A0A9P0MQT6_NEZVI|nr:unnamed protein product [Nezara viridula]